MKLLILIIILVTLKCHTTLVETSSRIQYLDMIHNSNDEVYKFDSLALNNHKILAIQNFQKIDLTKLKPFEKIYLIYRFNKTVFWQNYYLRSYTHSYYCDTISLHTSDTLSEILIGLNKYYSDVTTYLDESIVVIIKEYLESHSNSNNHLNNELLSELGRYYYNEGYTDYDHALNILEKAINNIKLGEETTVWYEAIKTLVYLQIPKRDKNNFLYYASKFKKSSNKLFNFDLNLLAHKYYLNGMAHYYNKFKESGTTFYNDAFALKSQLKDHFVLQEIFKSYISFRAWYIDTLDSAEKIKELTLIVNTQGDYNNLNRVIGEYHRIVNPESVNLDLVMEKAFNYAKYQKPYLKTQMTTILSMYGKSCMNSRNFEKALDIYFTEQYSINSSNILKFNLDSLLKQNKFNNFYFVSINSYAQVFLNKYTATENINNLLIAETLCQKADKHIINSSIVLDEENQISILRQINEFYSTYQLINLYLFEKTKNKKYSLQYLYTLERSKNSLLFRNIELNRNQNNLKDNSIDIENNYKAKINYFRNNRFEQESIRHYSQKLDFLAIKTDSINYNKIFYFESNYLKMLSENLDSISTKYIKNQYIDINLNRNNIIVFYLINGNPIVYSEKVTNKFVDTLEYVIKSQSGRIKFETQLYSKYSNYLYHKFFDKLELQNRFTISTNNIISELNIEALVQDTTKFKQSEKDYLISNHVIEYTPSFCIFIYNTSTSQVNSLNITRSNFFFFTNKNTIYNRNKLLAELPGNLTEFKTINGTLNSIIYSGFECTKNNFLNLSGDFKILHLGVHGKGNSSSFNNLYLLFRNNNNIDTVFVYELLNLHWKADLVFLSACETNKGVSIPGEGLYSLSRFFQMSGSRKVISALWDLSDSSSSELIQLFYKQYLIDGDSVLSLTTAKRSLIKKSTKFSKPFFWASLN